MDARQQADILARLEASGVQVHRLVRQGGNVRSAEPVPWREVLVRSMAAHGWSFTVPAKHVEDPRQIHLLEVL